MRAGLKALEISINRYLQLDPDTIARVATLSGKVIVVEISDWRLSWVIIPEPNGLTFSEDFSLVPTVTLRGKLFDMLKVGAAQGANEALFKNKIEMTGDMEAGEKIREILNKIDIDWEEHLSTIVGDVAAHQFIKGTRKIQSIGKKILDTFCGNVTEYVQVEASLLPTEAQVEKFFKALGKLRDDVDRLEARIQRLEGRKKK